MVYAYTVYVRIVLYLEMPNVHDAKLLTMNMLETVIRLLISEKLEALMEQRERELYAHALGPCRYFYLIIISSSAL